MAPYPPEGTGVTNDDVPGPDSQSTTVNNPTPVRRARKRPIFDKEGLRVADAAAEVITRGPLRYGQDGHFWAYAGGVWVDGEDELHTRIVDLLGNKYRTSHGDNVRAVIRARVPRISCAPTPDWINFRNGLLDWRTGQLHPHTPAVPSTVQLAVDWNPDAECPDFHDFLADVIPEDDRPRVWEVIGYMLMSGNPLHRAFLLAGGGRNGKGALLRTVLALLGESNVSNVPLHDLSSNRFATAQLYGRMANVCGDIDSTYLENTGRIKEITGEDQVQAEHKFGQPFRFTAWCSMLFSANSIPGSADSSRGWVDRWEVIAFPNYVGDRVDKTLEPRLQTPGSLAGIAVCAVAALRVLMDRGAFRTTESGRRAKEEFARKSNPLYDWLDERTTPDPDGWVKRPVAYEDYRTWAETTGVRQPMTRANFGAKLRQLTDRGITESKRQGIEGFKGFNLGRAQETAF